MRKPVQIILFVFFIAVVIELVVIAPSSLDLTNEATLDVSEEEAEQGVEQKMSGIHLIETKNESKDWELWAKEALTYKGREEWSLQGVKAIFFSQDGVTFEVTGQRGQVGIESKDMLIEGSVETKTSNGYLFKTDSIAYNSSERSLTTDSKVEMLGPPDVRKNRMKLQGMALHADLGNSLVEIKNDVKAENYFKKDKKVRISSQRSQFSGKDRYARFLDDVIIDFETMRLTGPDAVFQYDSEKDLVTNMMVQGGVKVSDLNKWATSDIVNVEFAKEKFVFKGRPRLVQNSDELLGEEIIFFDGGKRVKVKKAKAKVKNQNTEN